MTQFSKSLFWNCESWYKINESWMPVWSVGTLDITGKHVDATLEVLSAVGLVVFEPTANKSASSSSSSSSNKDSFFAVFCCTLLEPSVCDVGTSDGSAAACCAVWTNRTIRRSHQCKQTVCKFWSLSLTQPAQSSWLTITCAIWTQLTVTVINHWQWLRRLCYSVEHMKL